MLDFAAKVLWARGTCLFSVGQAGFIIKNSGGGLLAVDLYLSNCVERFEAHEGFKRLLPQILEPDALNFDAVICTHPHLDHFDVDAVPAMVGRGAELFCSSDCIKLIRQTGMEYYSSRINYIAPGDRAAAGGFRMTFVNCDHGEGAFDAVGVVVEVDGRIIYCAGDTSLRLDRTAEIPQPLDVLIAPINGMYGNMDAADCVKLAKALHPVLTIPCHYGMFASHGGDLKRFYDLMNENCLPVLLMQQGEQYSWKEKESERI